MFVAVSIDTLIMIRKIWISFGFLPHILQPTRITEYSSPVIDNIYGNNFEQNSQSGIYIISLSSLQTISHNSYPPTKKLPKLNRFL